MAYVIGKKLLHLPLLLQYLPGKSHQICGSGVRHRPGQVHQLRPVRPGLPRRDHLQPRPAAARPQAQPQTITADAVVLGAGGSGLVAAVRYRQLTGKKWWCWRRRKSPAATPTWATPLWCDTPRFTPPPVCPTCGSRRWSPSGAAPTARTSAKPGPPGGLWPHGHV